MSGCFHSLGNLKKNIATAIQELFSHPAVSLARALFLKYLSYVGLCSVLCRVKLFSVYALS